jgi:hypothetical protein
MSTTIISRDKGSITLQVTIEFSNSMLKSEEAILEALNEAGTSATKEALKQFDTDGSEIEIDGKKYTTKGCEPKVYQTPYGEVNVERHVYQSSSVCQTYCPLETDARIFITSTPRFSKMVSNKYATMPSTRVSQDLADNHGRNVARSYLQNLSEAVGQCVQAVESRWHYALPKLKNQVKTIGIGVDGANVFLSQEGYRETQVRTIAFYDDQCERLHTVYQAAAPEYGKATFWQRMIGEIENVKKLYPKAKYVGIADGAKDNWSFLEPHTSTQVLDFYHATEYLADIALAAHPRNKNLQQTWLDEQCHKLKHVDNGANQILTEITAFRQKKLGKDVKKKLESTITFFDNHLHQMDYAQFVRSHLPIGSGVTEAACCKTVVKQRLCQSGMRWKEIGASIVLGLRALVLTTERFSQFWNKINRYGLPQVT